MALQWAQLWAVYTPKGVGPKGPPPSRDAALHGWPHSMHVVAASLIRPAFTSSNRYVFNASSSLLLSVASDAFCLHECEVKQYC